MNKLRIVFLLMLVTGLASGCATRPWESRVNCAAIGAVAGGAVGGAVNSPDSILAGAAIGGVLGFFICPSSAEAAPPGDADGDGVTDDKDRCPTTPAGAKVDSNGCELDSDGDGVVDSKDACPDTPSGVEVDAQGCEIKAKAISLSGIYFVTDSAELKSESIAVLNATAETLKANPGVAVEIAGHTDSTGEADYNQSLSERRANAVREYLVSQGVDRSQLSANGYGESESVADNSTTEGRAENRRVELRVHN